MALHALAVASRMLLTTIACICLSVLWMGQPQVSKHDVFFANLALSRQYVSLTIYMWHDDRIWLRFVQSQNEKKENQHILFDEMTCGTAKGAPAHSSCTKIIQNNPKYCFWCWWLCMLWLLRRECSSPLLPAFPPESTSGASVVWVSCDVGQPQVSKHDMFVVNLAVSRQYVSLTICMWHDDRIWLRFVQSQIEKKEHQHILFGAHSSCTKMIQNTVVDVHGCCLAVASGMLLTTVACISAGIHVWSLWCLIVLWRGSTTSLQTWHVLCELGPIHYLSSCLWDPCLVYVLM